MNSSLTKGLAGAAFGLAGAALTGETDLFLLSDRLGYYLAGDEDFTAVVALLGRVSLASTFTSAFFATGLAGLVSFFTGDGFLTELARFSLFTGETSAFTGVGFTGVLAVDYFAADLAGVGFTSDLAGVGLTSDLAGVGLSSALIGVCLTGELYRLTGDYLDSTDLTADLGFDSDLTADAGLISDFTADLGLYSDFTSELGLISVLTVDLCFESDFLAEGFLGDGVGAIFGVGERPRSSLISDSSFMTSSS